MLAKYFRKGIKILEPSAIYGICIPTDGALMLTSMNNARYPRECDFGRFDYLERCGLLREMLKEGGNFPIAASTFRYRQPLWMFSRYKVETNLVWWDSKNFYFEQRVITISDGVIRGGGYFRNGSKKPVVDDVISKVYPNIQKPEIPEDLKTWIEYNEMNREMSKCNSPLID
ncbi:unnamed protein product [Allacma fusca]|uniref:Uncharacterized protein n=1 Tax=Allacma fusca TaxID=39272 RepID=A0A8J2KTT1_9HEXA|nr:unnamed protein product [Allacma fusca]